MATRIIPALCQVTDYTQAEETTLATSLTGQSFGSKVIFNTDLFISRIWNGTAFENQPIIPPTIVPIGLEVVNNQTLNYNLVLTDTAKLITCTKATQFVLGIPNDTTVAFLIGTNIRFLQGGAGQIAFVPVAPCVIVSSGAKIKTTSLYSRAVLTKVAANVWSLWGDITT